MSASEGLTSTPNRFIASFSSPRMEMGSYFHGFYYKISNELEEKCFHLVVVDKLTKESHFIPVKSTYKSDVIANIFMKEIFKLHGFPKAIISNKNTKLLPIFGRGCLQIWVQS